MIWQPGVLAQGSIAGHVTLENQDGEVLADHRDVVIFIDGIESTSQTESETHVPPKVSHKGREFSPKVLPIARGSTVNFFNDDNVFHNVFSLSKAKPFDLGIYPTGTTKLIQFDKPGLVKLYCNIHPKMVSSILVLNNAFFDVSDSDGSFDIQGLPSGTFTIRVWHEQASESSQQITIKDNEVTQQDFTVSLTRKIKPHKNKFGKSYRSKY
jgi:plastocyanin